jgi:Na+-translocating ferredoxin:NAD+ oxidoreductase subunit G
VFKIIKPALVLFLTCFIVTGLLALTYSSTKDIISGREQEKLKLARERVLESADSFDAVNSDWYGSVPSITGAYIGKDPGGAIVGAVINIESSGYTDKIKITAGIAADGTIEAVEITEQTETPGLGAKIADSGFLSQFSFLFSKQELVVIKILKTKDNEIEAVSGATISSKAATAAVNIAKKTAMEILSKAGEDN